MTLPLVIDVDTALLLQEALAVSLNLTEDATIFEICAAINATGLNIDAVLDVLDVELTAAVTTQITLLVNQIVAAIEEITGTDIPASVIAFIITLVDIDAIVDDITANVNVSLGILEACLGLPPTPPPPIEGLKLNIVWQDIPEGSNEQDILYGSNLNNETTTFTSPVNVSNNDEPSLFPRVASLGERIFVTWVEQGIGELQDEVFFAKSEDGGLTFTQPINISKTSGGISNDSEVPDIAAFGDNVYIVWEEANLDFGSKIFFSKSIDGGDTFSEPISLIDSRRHNSWICTYYYSG